MDSSDEWRATKTLAASGEGNRSVGAGKTIDRSPDSVQSPSSSRLDWLKYKLSRRAPPSRRKYLGIVCQALGGSRKCRQHILPRELAEVDGRV